ncbi:hypothetical protein GW17_00003885 [Ensete ventricosum]|nr:hypothetical protein GW17_00003885 [Ensete ventricosum]RZS19671.1 hypothetical protein BHM03_00052090 [Ensete ventricosum]
MSMSHVRFISVFVLRKKLHVDKANSGRTKPWSGVLFNRNYYTLIKLQYTDQQKLTTKMRAGRTSSGLLQAAVKRRDLIVL